MSIARKVLMGSSGGKKSTYVDDVFSTYVYKGTQGSNIANTGLDMTKGGLVWYKNRSGSNTQHIWTDTVRGANKVLYSDANNGETDTSLNQTFTNTGWTQNNGYTDTNQNNQPYASWNFRKQEGFFDIVSYTGNGSNRNISHNLGCKPGMIIIKDLDDTDNWEVYHQSLPEWNGSDHYYLIFNSTVMNQYGASRWNNTPPTASSFRLGQSTSINQNGNRYIAYLFAGGQSDATGARSVNFAGNEKLEVPSSTDFNFGSGAFTIECWVKFDGNSANHVFVNRSYWGAAGNSSWLLYGNANGNVDFYGTTNSSSWNLCQMSAPAKVNDNQWHHVAVVRDNVGGGEIRIYVDGTLKKSQTINTSAAFDDCTRIVEIGSQWNSAWLTGRISNLRIVKGTAVYTSSFKPSTVPLTNISGTVLLCCNDPSVTGATVTPGTITAVNSPDAHIYNPFMDPESFKFGEDEDQNIVKCGSYMGDNSLTIGPEIYLGWEPQWVMIKSISSAEPWMMFDSMRGLPDNNDSSGGLDRYLAANSWDPENGNTNWLALTATGFKIKSDYNHINENQKQYAYIAIRRTDALVGKPPEAATDVFNIAYGTPGSTIPKYPSGFITDLTINRQPASAVNWRIQSRLTGNKRWYTDTTGAAGTNSNVTWDFMTGSNKSTSDASTWLAWHWKRHAGFDVVTYKGNGTAGSQIQHSLGKAPEMIWIRDIVNSENWFAWHHGLNNGTDSWQYGLELNNNNQEVAYGWQRAAPTSTCFTVGSHGMVNASIVGNNSFNYCAMLFASVDGISKCGYYTGTNGSASPGGDIAQTITTGFSPRFVIIKRVDSANDWLVLDTTRGWGAGGDANLFLDADWAQSSFNFGAPTSTGFGLTYDELGYYNSNGGRYIYYAHA